MLSKSKGAFAFSSLTMTLAITLPSAAQSVRDADDSTTIHFAKEIGVSVQEAKRRLYLQSLAGEFQEEVANIAPEVFGGLYIENEPELKVVLLTTNGGRQLVAPLLTDRFAPLSSIVDARHVDRSMRELEELVEESATMLHALGQHASFDIDIKTNTAVIISENPEELIKLLSAAGRELPDGVQVRKGRGAKKLARIFGGKDISECTSGFAVVHQDGRRGITTAGHCGNNSQIYGGIPLLWVYGRDEVDWDVQWHTTEPYTPSNIVQVGLSLVSITAMKGRLGQAVGEYVCKVSRPSGYACGYIRTIGFKPGIQYSATFIGIGPMTGEGGDSGGPFLKSNTAYGILSGSYVLENENRLYYMAADRIESGLNVSVLLVP